MIAHFDCFSGISGDMTLGAFMDLGVPVQWLAEQLAALPLDGFDLTVEPAVRHGITGKKAHVAFDESAHPRDHAAIVKLIEASPLADRTKETALAIFDRLATAEAKIHGRPKDHVHFHEVGGVDAIVDIVGAALCMEYLDIDRATASSVALGKGFVKSAHGVLPVPAPATLEILRGVPVHDTGIPFELTTPTGAAIVSTLATAFEPKEDRIPVRIGYGAGGRDLEQAPNLLRIVLFREPAPGLKRALCIETNIDDMPGELFGNLMDRLFDAGARDVAFIPIQMKKNRPGVQVQAICLEPDQEAVVRTLLAESTAIGARAYPVARHVLARRAMVLDTPFGPVAAKEVTLPDGRRRIAPEFEACREAAVNNGVSLSEVFTAAQDVAGRIAGAS